MVATTKETLTVNGVVLNTLAKNIDTITGRLRAPAYRTGNIVVPGRHGELRVPDKKFQANTISLPMWVVGSDDDGGLPSGKTARQTFKDNVNELVALFKGTGEPLDIRWTQPDGSVRQCFAEAEDVLDFTGTAHAKANVGVVLNIYGAFWQDLDPITKRYTVAGGTIDPSDYAGGQAPIEDMIYTFDGPWSGPGLTFSDGTWFVVNDTLKAGQSLTVNCGRWRLEGVGGYVPDYAKLSHDGRDSSWGAMPASAKPITLRGSGRSTDSSLLLAGRRKFLVG